MKKILALLLMILPVHADIYSVPIEAGDGSVITWDAFRGHVILIVNTASQCGFTGQYEPLQKLHETYYTRGLRVVSFPCNQFGNQETGSYYIIVDNAYQKYGVTFPIYAKIDVSGDNQAPIYRYLKSQAKDITGGMIPWNFTKFLISRQGKLVDYFYPTVSLDQIEEAIKFELGQ